MSAVIQFENVSKHYRIGTGRYSLREALYALPKRLVGHGDWGLEGDEYIWALKDVNFDVERGKVLGIIGPNGAGKTTVLKLLSKVIKPTSGQIHVNGQVSALIELGAGFHPDLTGRENIYLNGAILGLSKKEIDEKFDHIVEFAELEKFIDTPVKRYSSGMYARLGFSVAAHTDPDLLLVDEVLAVGDASFQRKCYDFIHSFVSGGNTAVIVSHNLFVVEQLCNHLIWLEGGHIIMTGQPGQVLPAYLDSVDQRTLASSAAIDSVDGHLRIVQVGFADVAGNESQMFMAGDDIIVQVKYLAKHSVDRPHFCLGVASAEGGKLLFLASMLIDGNAPASIKGEGVLSCRFKSVPLMPKVYHVWGEIWGADRAQILVSWQRLGTFRIVGGVEGQKQQVDKGGIRHLRADAPIRVLYEWEY